MTNIIRLNKKMQHLWRGCIKHNFIEHIMIFTISHCTKACIFIIIIIVVVRRRRRIPPFKPRMSGYKDQLLRLLNTIP
ncbi:hypothetical protein HanRHA438_Chr03g0142921 [Helianthus annuus]|nr:hypothetical protein HanRHA438_Chr03g0142921 [Helianthus annuus]